MLSSKIRTRNRTGQPDRKKDATNKLSLLKDILDVVLKIFVVLLTLPAFAIFAYLRAIHRVDLFVPAVLSATGLAALLQASLFFFVAIVIGFAAPSWLAALMVDTYPKGSKPTPASAVLILVSGTATTLYFLWVFYVLDKPWLAWSKYVPLAIVLVGGISSLVYVSPRFFRVLTQPERSSIKLRLRASAVRTALSIVVGLFTLSAVQSVSPIVHLYRLSEDGWQGYATVGAAMVASIIPGAAYVYRRSRGDIWKTAFYRSSALVLLPFVALVVLGFSLEPISLVTMKSMGIAETSTRTFELIPEKEQPTYEAVGFTFMGSSKFFPAVLRFQFGDVRLLCVEPYDASLKWPIGGPFQSSTAKPVDLPDTECITSQKDETRVLTLPKKFKVTAIPATAVPHKAQNHGKPLCRHPAIFRKCGCIARLHPAEASSTPVR